MKNQLKKSLKTMFILSIAVLFSFSCTIGLGEAVDMESPVLKVESPATLSSVPQSFEVKGYATDNNGVSKILVEISETGQQYKYEQNKWQKYVGGKWVNYESAQVSGSAKDLQWKVVVSIQNAKSAEDYTIVCQAYDEMGNEGKTSKDERTVTMDIVEPTVSIIDPVMTTLYEDAKKSKENYKIKDNNILQSLINGEFVISGYQKEDTSLSALYVYLDEGIEQTISPYTEENDILKLISPIFSKKITGASLRNWEISVNLPQEYSILPDSNDPDKDKPEKLNKLIRLITESHDTAGNVERKVQGWFIYCPKADIPWIEASFGDSEFKEVGQSQVYPSCTLQGQTYDDDGLAEVKIVRSVYDSLTDEWSLDSEPIIEDLSEEDYPKYYAWSLSSISENKKFKVEISCKDKNGVEGDPVVRYMAITDTTPPSIKINSPANGSTVISRKITITGTVQDDGKIESLKMVRLQNENKKDMLDYFSDSYDGWTTEKNGNKLFDIELEGSDDAVGGYVIKTFSKEFDIFDDFGISESEDFNTQNFVFKAVDNNRSATIEFYTLQGDTEAPEIAIETVTVYSSSGTKLKEYSLKDGNTPTLDPFNKSLGTITDRIVISGSWSDNSYDEWKDLSKIGKVKLTLPNCEGEIEIAPTIDENSGKKVWKSEKLTPDSNSTCAISAELKDFGGNISKTSASYYVNNSLPELVRITTANDTPDGSYKVGDTINIVLEYNKKVTISKINENNTEEITGPTLNLNNGGKAYYDKSSNTNGSAKHYYKYIVGSDDLEIEKLSVSSITLPEDENIKDSDKTKIPDATKLPAQMNLQDLRSITIDKTAPTVNEISAFTSGGYYSVGKEIFIQMQFSEDVIFQTSTRSAVDDVAVKLLMNTGKYTASTTKTSSKDLLIKYTIADADSANPLKITSIDWSNYYIVDKAGNELIKPEITSKNDISAKGIYIDTTTPDKPIVTIKQGDNPLSNNDIVYNDAGADITIDWGTNTGNVKKFSVDGGASWSDWGSKTKESLNISGPYEVVAYQINAAGTVSPYSDSVKVTLDMGNILTSVSSTVADGVYSTNKEIPIILKFRKPVTISSDAKLELNVSNTDGNKCYAELSDKTEIGLKDKTELKFVYTTKNNDNVKELNVKDFSFTSITDESGNDISSFVPLPTAVGYRLEDSRKIEINTSIPAVENVSLDETGKYPVLKIKFNSTINKGTGNIVIKQDKTTYIPPVLLSESQYLNYSKKDTTKTIENSYELTTNGASNTGVSDLTKKYVLKYNLDSKDNKSLINAFDRIGALVISVSIKSPVVSINEERDTVLIPLNDNYKLPVKGAEYTVEIPANLVSNDLNIKNLKDTETRKIIPTGVEAPIIRINKSGFTISGTTITQPDYASVKMDCQTPGAEIYYTKSESKPSTHTYEASNKNSAPTAKTFTLTNSKPTKTESTDNVKYSDPFDVAKDESVTNGYKLFLWAKAFKNTDESEDSFETAYKTVVILKDSASAPFSYRWIRGGDAPSGGVTTPGFPLSWENTDYTKICPMTFSDSNVWYFSTWNITTTAYVGFLSGDLPEDSANGPESWCWGSCSWVNYKETTPVYPGESFTYDSSQGYGGGDYGYQAKHKEYRNESGVHVGTVPIKIPSGTTEVLSAEATSGADWGKSSQIYVKTDYDYKIGTVLYVTIDAASMNINFKNNMWGTDIWEGEREGPIFILEIKSNDQLNALKNNSLWWQCPVKGKITSIKALN